jgi:hypothetical protein
VDIQPLKYIAYLITKNLYNSWELYLYLLVFLQDELNPQKGMECEYKLTQKIGLEITYTPSR